MHIMGRGRFKYLTMELRNPRATRFSQLLFRACGCVLVWHKRRLVYVVCRKRGHYVAPQTYCDVKDPLISNVPIVAQAVRFADARLHGDVEKMMEIYDREWKYKSKEETRAFVRDFFPDYMHALNRADEIVRTGSKGKYFDCKVDKPFVAIS